MGAVQPDDLAVLPHAPTDQDLAVVEEIEFAGEIALPMDRDHLLLAVGGVDDLDAALEDDEAVDASLAACEDGFALGEGLSLTEGFGAGDLFGGQLRKDLCLALVGIARVGDGFGGGQIGHVIPP